MHPKIKCRPPGARHAIATARPLLLHDVTNTTASAHAASRRRLLATHAVAGTANHARHPVPGQAQS